MIANKQNGLERALEAMRKEWTTQRFKLLQYKTTGVKIIGGVEDVNTLIDDHLVKTQVILSSPYVGHIESQAKGWEEKLLHATALMDAWMSCQRSWLYLEPVFGSPEIMRQMPREGRKFAAVDSVWRRTMTSVEEYPKVRACVCRTLFLHCPVSFVRHTGP